MSVENLFNAFNSTPKKPLDKLLLLHLANECGSLGELTTSLRHLVFQCCCSSTDDVLQSLERLNRDGLVSYGVEDDTVRVYVLDQND